MKVKLQLKVGHILAGHDIRMYALGVWSRDNLLTVGAAEIFLGGRAGPEPAPNKAYSRAKHLFRPQYGASTLTSTILSQLQGLVTDSHHIPMETEDGEAVVDAVTPLLLR